MLDGSSMRGVAGAAAGAGAAGAALTGAVTGGRTTDAFGASSAFSIGAGVGSGARTGVGWGCGVGLAARGVGKDGGGVGTTGLRGGGAGGAGGATNSLSNAAGTMSSSGCRWLSAPCNAHRAAPCARAMPATTAALRLPWGAGRNRSEDIKKNSCQRTQNMRWQPIGLQIQRLKIQGSARPMTTSEKPSVQTSMGRFQTAQAQAPPPTQAHARTESFRSAATGLLGLHCATTSRAQPSHWPHWVATPNSHWISSKPMPARAWRAISRSEIRRQTQTIMAGGGRAVGWRIRHYYKCESVALTIYFVSFFGLRASSSVR